MKESNSLLLKSDSPDKVLAGPTPTQAVRGFRPWSSVTILLTVFLSILYAWVYTSFPWRQLAAMDSSAWIVERAAQAPEYIFSNAPAQDLLILGSSLILAPSERLNDMEEPKPGSLEKTGSAPRATIYQNEIRRLNGRNHSIKILAVPGAMASDQLKVVEYLLEEKKQPALLIFTYAPRDFMANDVGDNPDYTPTGRVFHFSNLEHNFLPRSLTPAKIEDCFKAHGNFIDSVRRWKLRQLKELACKLTSHPETLFHAAYKAEQKAKDAAPVEATAQAGAEAQPAAPVQATTPTAAAPETAAATQTPATAPTSKAPLAPAAQEKTPVAAAAGSVKNSAPSTQDKALLKVDLDLYKSRYQPINHKRIKQQLSYMEEMLSRLKQANVPVILLGMPISKENQDIIGQAEYRRLREMIAATGTRYGAETIDMNEGPETFILDKDFTDSVHLNQVGASRFVNIASVLVTRSKAYQKAFEISTKTGRTGAVR
ncbi:MAG: SGNH/GDSL hydrolase family protein [Candidatus Melainabacteria bacterium]|nr:SGNH/GDSL hydrolase family protein [Candidatus Melainabacteria bacterium]